jgi:carboxypeptidase C (cathepsin A)
VFSAYTGYLDVDYGTKHLFFYFFESRDKPDEDDVVMWINGGPGSSSTVGLLMELGKASFLTLANDIMYFLFRSL